MKIDNNTIRYYLHTYDCLLGDIRLLRELIDDFRAMQIDSIAKSTSGIRVQGGKPGSMTEDIAAERADILIRHESRLAELLIVYGGIRTYRNSLTEGSLNWCILEFRYLGNKCETWLDVKKMLEKYNPEYTYEVNSIMKRDVEILNNIVKRCVFRAQKKEGR